MNRSTRRSDDCARRASTSLASHSFVEQSYIICVLATLGRVNWCFVQGKSEKRCTVLSPPSRNGSFKSARQKRQSGRRNHKQTRLMLVYPSTPKGKRHSESYEARIWKKYAVYRLIIHVVITDMFVARVRVGASSVAACQTRFLLIFE